MSNHAHLLDRPRAPFPSGHAYGLERSFRVLVVDDNPAIHRDFEKVLTPPTATNDLAAIENLLLGPASEGSSAATPRVQFRLQSAFQGPEAVALVREAVAEDAPFAVAFVDMRIPSGQDGLATTLELWAIDPCIQVVLCSAYTDYSWAEITAKTGETDRLVILRKPFEPIEVVQLAHALSKKWEVQRALRRHVEELEETVAKRTREVEERHALFQLILENTTDLIAVVDANGHRVYNSPSYQTVLGFSAEELRTTHALAQIHPEDVERVNAAVDVARRTGRGETIVYRMQHRDGSWRTLESCAGVVRDAAGRMTFLVIVARDVTERRKRELEQQLGLKLESIGRLAAGIAHEINTPTQYITDNTRFLADGFRTLSAAIVAPSGEGEKARPDGERPPSATPNDELAYLLTEIPQALQQNLEGLARISRIVGSLKEFSHPNAPTPTPSDLNRAIETATVVSRHEWKYVAELVTDLQADLPLVPCVLDEINQVLLNLIVNAAHTIGDALKARGETRGTITIRTRQDGDHAVIEVSDNGLGIPAAVRSRVFEPFFTTKGIGKGTGQGLAIVYASIVQHHRGTVDFVTEEGKGTTFRLRLPFASPRSS